MNYQIIYPDYEKYKKEIYEEKQNLEKRYLENSRKSISFFCHVISALLILFAVFFAGIAFYKEKYIYVITLTGFPIFALFVVWITNSFFLYWSRKKENYFKEMPAEEFLKSEIGYTIKFNGCLKLYRIISFLNSTDIQILSMEDYDNHSYVMITYLENGEEKKESLYLNGYKETEKEETILLLNEKGELYLTKYVKPSLLKNLPFFR